MQLYDAGTLYNELHEHSENCGGAQSRTPSASQTNKTHKLYNDKQTLTVWLFALQRCSHCARQVRTGHHIITHTRQTFAHLAVLASPTAAAA
jgi:hypothetical protein